MDAPDSPDPVVPPDAQPASSEAPPTPMPGGSEPPAGTPPPGSPETDLPPLELPEEPPPTSDRPSWEKWALGILAVIVLAFLALWLMRDTSGGTASPTAAAVTAMPGAPTEAIPTMAPPTPMAPASPSAEVVGPPTAVISGPTSGTVGQPLTFSATASSGPSAVVIYTWDFGDGDKANGATVTHAYDLAGSFAVRLAVQDATGQVDDTRQAVTIQAAPQKPPDAVISGPSAGQTGQSLTFDASASTAPSGSSITAYTWTFGDGTQGSGKTVSHSFSQAGSYYVVLEVTAANGLSDTASQQVTISSPQPPKAVIQGPTSTMVGQSVSFTASASTSGSPITSYLWAFGDGSTTNAVVASYAYDTPGNYTVSLTVVDQTGAKSTATSPMTVSAAPTKPPKAALSGPSVAMVGQAATFSASGSTPGSSPIASYFWSINGLDANSSASGATLTWTPKSPGTVVVEVIVTDQAGLTDAASQEVAVSPDLSSVVWVLNASRPTITLSVYQGQGGGSTGCNTYQFTYTVSNAGAASGSVTVGPITSTTRPCSEPASAQEQTYLKTLQQVTSYNIAGNQMQLAGPGGTLSFTGQ